MQTLCIFRQDSLTDVMIDMTKMMTRCHRVRCENDFHQYACLTPSSTPPTDTPDTQTRKHKDLYLWLAKWLTLSVYPPVLPLPLHHPLIPPSSPPTSSQMRKHKDLYLWLAKSPSGPSVKFLVSGGERDGVRG